MLVACQLAALSALEARYAGFVALTQPTQNVERAAGSRFLIVNNVAVGQ
jgi:hypothetical protein